jgi:hypothetical protein
MKRFVCLLLQVKKIRIVVAFLYYAGVKNMSDYQRLISLY